jgi:hypothetical protein
MPRACDIAFTVETYQESLISTSLDSEWLSSSTAASGTGMKDVPELRYQKRTHPSGKQRSKETPLETNGFAASFGY